MKFTILIIKNNEIKAHLYFPVKTSFIPLHLSLINYNFSLILFY